MRPGGRIYHWRRQLGWPVSHVLLQICPQSNHAGEVRIAQKSMSKYLIDQIEATSNIEVKGCCQVVEAMGEERLSCLRLSGPEGECVVPANGLYIFIGAAPNTDWLRTPSCVTQMGSCCRVLT